MPYVSIDSRELVRGIRPALGWTGDGTSRDSLELGLVNRLDFSVPKLLPIPTSIDETETNSDFAARRRRTQSE